MTTKTTDKAQIRAVIEEWADALRNKDANRMLSHCAPNLVHFSLARRCSRLHRTQKV
ncbi:MAG: hypothetical protein QOH31_4049 [Verrucomicrobiota bacterium]|jgi:PhnB protein